MPRLTIHRGPQTVAVAFCDAQRLSVLLERAGRRVKLVPGRRENIKITTPEDRELAEFYLKKGTE